MPRVTGSIVTVERNSGPVLFIKARDRTGRQIKKRLGPEADWSKRKRQDALRDFLTDLGRSPDGPADEITIGDAALAWLAYVEHEKARAPSTVSDYTNTVNGSILPHFGKDKPLSTIEREDVDEFRLALLERVSRRTAQKTLVLLYGLLKYAKRRRWLIDNPAEDAERVTVKRRTEFAVLDPDEVAAVVRQASEPAATAIVVSAFTGLRLGELRSLKWRDVDFTNRLLHVRRSVWRTTEGTPKSGKARSLPLDDLAARPLDLLSRREHFTAPNDLVFCTPHGSKLDEGELRDGLYEAMKQAGIDRDRGTGKLFVWHDLRHSYGTLAVQIYDPMEVKHYMGHAQFATTEIYLHHRPKPDAAGKLDRLVAKLGGYRMGTERSEPEVSERT